MAPFIQIASSPLAQAGKAMAEATKGEAQHQQNLTRQLIQNRRYEQAEAEAQIELRDRQEKEQKTRLQKLQQGFQQAMNIGADLGVDTNLTGYKALDEELRINDPETWEQVNEIAPYTEDVGSVEYQYGYIARGKAVGASRETRTIADNKAQLEGLEADADIYTEAELLELAAAAESQTPSEFKASVAKARDKAVERALLAEQQTFAKDEVRRIAKSSDTAGKAIEKDTRASAAMTRILKGTSSDPSSDLDTVAIAANGHSDTVDKLVQQGVIDGMGLERLTAANKLEKAALEEDYQNQQARRAESDRRKVQGEPEPEGPVNAPRDSSVPSRGDIDPEAAVPSTPPKAAQEEAERQVEEFRKALPVWAGGGTKQEQEEFDKRQEKLRAPLNTLDPEESPEAHKAVSGLSDDDYKVRDDLKAAGIDPNEDPDAAREFIKKKKEENPNYPKDPPPAGFTQLAPPEAGVL